MWTKPTPTEMGEKNTKKNEQKEVNSTVRLSGGEESLPTVTLENPEVELRTLKLNFVGEPSRKFANTKLDTPIDSYRSRDTKKKKEKMPFLGKEPSLSD